jgi:dipeptidase E
VILLTSAGIFGLKTGIGKLFPKPPAESKIAYVITAVKPEPNPAYSDNERNKLIEAGFSVEDVDIEGKGEEELRRIIEGKDIIYVQGGNTFYLLKQIKESGFDRVVKEALARGKTYIGASAGSYVAGPTIESAGWKHQDRNLVGLTDLTAMNLVPFLITAHYQPKYAELIREGVKKSNYPVKILTDDQAILIKDGEVKLLGGEETKI